MDGVNHVPSSATEYQDAGRSIPAFRQQVLFRAPRLAPTDFGDDQGIRRNTAGFTQMRQRTRHEIPAIGRVEKNQRCRPRFRSPHARAELWDLAGIWSRKPHAASLIRPPWFA